MGVTEKGTVTALKKEGSGSLDPTSIEDMMEVSDSSEGRRISYIQWDGIWGQKVKYQGHLIFDIIFQDIILKNNFLEALSFRMTTAKLMLAGN